MIKDARFCKGCTKYTKNFQQPGNVLCLTCRENMNKGPLYCTMCGKSIWECYTPQRLCSMCAFAVKVGKKNAVEETTQQVKKAAEQVTKAIHAMQKGTIQKLPKGATALWMDQWAVQGSAKFPYIVSHKKNAAGSDIEWQCSCPAWTTTTPREDCKHILKIKLVEKVPFASNDSVGLVKKKTVIVVETEDSKKGILSLNTFEKKGRKFR